MLQKIIDEFNPANDIESGMIDFEEYYDKILPAKKQRHAKFDGWSKFVKRFVKPITRGSIYGGAIGALYGYISSQDITYCMREGGIIGLEVDFLQYNLRFHFGMPRTKDFLNRN